MKVRNVLLCLVNMAILSAVAETGASYTAEVKQRRHQKEAALKADDGWLTVTGLLWLKEGANHIGSDPSSDILLSDQIAPPHLGTLNIRGDSVSAQ